MRKLAYVLWLIVAVPLSCAELCGSAGCNAPVKVDAPVTGYAPMASPQLEFESRTATSQASGPQTGGGDGSRTYNVGPVNAGSSTVAVVALCAVGGLYLWHTGRAVQAHRRKRRNLPPVQVRVNP